MIVYADPLCIRVKTKSAGSVLATRPAIKACGFAVSS